ncbi:deleted in malignant brain tumors 1 protein-like [Strongylocentrotus purpuratus]|uniref:SRCR domain-containing protein n=1 Tax=Strongylocentrotus purpuratus TaxID=7668 RepID=A0A7M7P8F6_STRPU|nr:deleted in malignant brain tumors 1 protein-like [Strongylocentrotus purpuratus]
MSTTDSTTSHYTTTTQSTTTQDATTMSTTESTTSHPTTTTQSTTTQDTTTMTTTESTTSHPTTTTQSTTTQDTTTMSTTESRTSHPTTTTESTTTQDTTTMSTTESATSHPTTTTHEIEGGIRLVDGYSSDEGRVEIFHEGQWGTVCDDDWDDSDASVVCRQLGYSGDVGVATGGATYGQGSGPIYLDDVGCSGKESRLTDCSNGGWGNHNCDHSEDAGVYCGDEIEGKIRLVDGYSSDEGRVEISFHEGQWGTVCDNGWDDSDARVVCRQLGYSGNVGVARSGATYGQGSGPIYLDDVGCSGNESRLTDCSNGGWGNHYCRHDEDAGVYCGEVLFRLVDGYSSDEGRVEISFHEGQWGTVCDNGWDDSDARVVCRQLGYSGNVGVARSGATYGQGSGPIYLDDVGCSGNEYRLTDCSNGGWGNHYCGHAEDAGVDCSI